jgi:ubiquinone/menaquinone biosynthesis C-methylase UbiE
MTNAIDEVNLRTMRSRSAVEHYSYRDDLTPPERASLDQVAASARGRPILDIGVGAGRTVKALLEISPNYLGIDNSREMLAACQRRFPGVELAHADARRMNGIADGSIFLVMFSCNGIGMVSHDDRRLIMREVFRVLEPGGVFLFSNHNQHCPDHEAGFKFPLFVRSANPARLAVRALRYLVALSARMFNRNRFLKHEVRTSDYSVINDVCHDYGTMLYYISLANQRRQLVDLGFESDAMAYDLDGRAITTDTADSSIAYIARKPR